MVTGPIEPPAMFSVLSCLATLAALCCSAQARTPGLSNPLIPASLLDLGGVTADHAEQFRHHHDGHEGPGVPDPAPRRFGGRCGVAACDDIPFPTPWSKDVDPKHPWPEYPRPQMQRPDWLNLNGVWEFEAAGGDGHLEPAFNRTLKDEILVPFPPEAPLSGQKRPDGSSVNLLYKRTFSVPSAWGDARVLLHFGAVDYECTVSVNHLMLGVHHGGYNKFSLDITDALKVRTAQACPQAAPEPTAPDLAGHHKHKKSHSGHCQEGVEHVVVVRAWDPADTQRITVGKQRLFPPRHPAGIFYTSTSGIWQTVWLEPVPEAHITQVVPRANLQAGEVALHVHGSQAAEAREVVAVVSSEGNALAMVCGNVGSPFAASLASPRLWSPEDPHLYDVDVALRAPGDAASCQELGRALWEQVNPQGAAQSLLQRLRSLSAAAAGWLGLSAGLSQARQLSGQDADHVRGYFGMREVGLGPVGPGGHPRPLINGEFVFQIGMLDQGYWPDGIYTAPTDDALIYDLQVAKRLGFNMLRKHTKIEPDRWYYHADRLGMLVWQDQPDQFGDDRPPPEVQAQFEHELATMIAQHQEFPSIIAWVVFNEGWGQYDTERIVNMTKRLDPSRLADCASGWNDAPVGDFIDMHNYVGPGSPLPTSSRAAVLGEFGGLGLRVDGHRFVPQEDFCYELQGNSAQLEVRYLGLVEHLKELMMSNNTALSAAVYTELSDVEGEINGFMTYDRKVVKVEPYAMPAAHKGLLTLSRSLNKPHQS